MPIGTAGFLTAGTVGANLLGGIMQNSANATQARQARDWSAYMRSTAYQATVDDMQKAGLNPMLAYSQGASGTPSAAMATMQNTLGPAAQAGSSTYSELTSAQLKNVQSDQAREQVINTAADTEVKRATADNVDMDTRMKAFNSTYLSNLTDKVRADTSLTRNEQDLVIRKIRNAVLEGFNIEADTQNKKIDAYLKSLDIPESLGRASEMKGPLSHIKPWVEVGGKVMNSAGTAARALKN